MFSIALSRSQLKLFLNPLYIIEWSKRRDAVVTLLFLHLCAVLGDVVEAFTWVCMSLL